MKAGRDEFADVDGIVMRWRADGAGVPIVLVHGIPTGPALWRHVIPRVHNARCLAWEMVGYGASIAAGVGRDISVARQADYLASWLRHMDIDHAVLAGHDLGGGVVQILAVRNPGLCAGLFLTNSIGYDSWPIPSVRAMRSLGPVVRNLPPELFRPVFSSFLRRGHDRQAVATESIAAHWPPYATHGAAAFVRQIYSLDVNDTLAVAGKLPELAHIPARIVWGAADQFQKIEYGERFAKDLRAPLHRITNGKHFTPEDHPDAVAEAINELVRTFGSGRGEEMQ